MKRKKRKKTKKAVSLDFANSVIAEDFGAERLSNTKLKINVESPREYWFHKFAWSLPTIIVIYMLIASIFKMLVFFEIFMQTFAVTLLLSILGFYKLRQINDYLIIDQSDRMIYKVEETAKQSTKSKYLACDDIKQIGIDCFWKKESKYSCSCHYQIIALTQSKKLIPLSEWVGENYGIKEFTKNLSKFLKVEFKKPPDTEEGSKLYRKGDNLIYKDFTAFFGPYWLSNIISLGLLLIILTVSSYALVIGIDYSNPNTQELKGDVIFALVWLIGSSYSIFKALVLKERFR